MTPEKPALQSSTIIFLRHGESIGNAENRHQGQADFPLTDLGVKQAEILAEDWKTRGWEFDQVISSPQTRARETAEILARVLGFEIIYNPIWKERDNGKLAGLLHEEALREIPPPDFISLYAPIADTGESQWDLYLRAGSALDQLVQLPAGRFLVVSHGGFLNMVMHALVGVVPQPNFQGPHFRFSNTGYSLVRFEPGKDNWIILEHNNTSHLKAV